MDALLIAPTLLGSAALTLVATKGILHLLMQALLNRGRAPVEQSE